MALKTCLIILSSLLVLASCAKEPEIVVETKFIDKNIAVVGRPPPVKLSNVSFSVVSKETFEEFIAEFADVNATDTFIVISVRDYEKLSLNVAELKRYIEQQDKIIVYYEKSVK